LFLYCRAAGENDEDGDGEEQDNVSGGNNDDEPNSVLYSAHLGRLVFLSLVKTKYNMLYVEIRQKWPMTGESSNPNTRGVVMPAGRYLVLKDRTEELTRSLHRVISGDSYVKQMFHLGSDMYASVSSPYKCVNVRHWYRDSSRRLKPGRGISFTNILWEQFQIKGREMENTVPEMGTVERCFDKECHQNQEGYFGCRECNERYGESSSEDDGY
jgi:hypothetical protein